MSDQQPSEIAIGYRETYLKLVDLFETRQTWAFNFAFVTYVACFGALGAIVSDVKDHTGVALLAVAFGLPLLIYPLFCLYVDVSAYCAALHSGNRKHLEDRSTGRTGPLDPQARAYDWLRNNKCRTGSRYHRDLLSKVLKTKNGRTDSSDGLAFDECLHRASKGRLMLFCVASCVGLVASFAVLASMCDKLGLLVFSIVGVILNSVLGYETFCLCQFVVRARHAMAEEMSKH
jgi:hypothetical protein